MGTQAHLFGPGPSLDLVDWDTIQHPRYAVNLAAFGVPDCTGAITADYNMLRYYERRGLKMPVYSFKTRHSFNLNIHYIDANVPIWLRQYSTTAALALLHSYGLDILATGFDAMRGIEGYASKVFVTDYTDLAKQSDHRPIVRHIKKYLDTSGRNVVWL